MIENSGFSKRDLAHAMHLPNWLAKRFVANLETEGYVEVSDEPQKSAGSKLELTEHGTSKIEQMIAVCTETLLKEATSSDASALFTQS